MKIVINSILLFVFSLSIHLNAQTKNESLNWLSFEQLDDSLQVKPKKTLIFFHTDWCSYCKKMLRESFADRNVIQKLRNEYYIVKFDAESRDTVHFDGVSFTNNHPQGRRNSFHPIVTLLTNTQEPKFPTTIILNEDFTIKKTKHNYLSIKELLKIL